MYCATRTAKATSTRKVVKIEQHNNQNRRKLCCKCGERVLVSVQGQQKQTELSVVKLSCNSCTRKVVAEEEWQRIRAPATSALSSTCAVVCVGVHRNRGISSYALSVPCYNMCVMAGFV